MPAYIDKVANVSGMLKADPDLLIDIASISKPRVFLLTPFLNDDGERRCQIIGKGSHSLNDAVATMTVDRIQILKKQLDYASMGPCEAKYLKEKDCEGYRRCADSFLRWAENRSELTRLQAQELAETLRDCAEYERSCKNDPSILRFHWTMKTLYRKPEYGGGSILTYEYHLFNPVEHIDPVAEAERQRMQREILRQVGHPEQKKQGEEEEEEEDCGEDCEEDDSSKAEARRLLELWDIVEKSQDDGLTVEQQDFNLAQSAIELEQRKSTSVTVSKDVVTMQVGFFVALFAAEKNGFSVAKVQRIFKWKRGVRLSDEHKEEVRLGDGHDIFFTVHFWGPREGDALLLCDPKSCTIALVPRVYRSNEVARLSGKTNQPSLDVVGVSQVVCAFPDLTKSNKLRRKVFALIADRVALRAKALQEQQSEEDDEQQSEDDD